MKMRVLVAIIITVAVGVAAYAITGHFVRDARPRPAMMEAGSLAAQLQLTAQQREHVETLNATFAQQREEIREQHRAHRMELVELLGETPADRERIDEKLAEIGALQATMQRLAVDHILDVSAELDEQQRQRFFELIGEAMCPGEVLGRGRGWE